MTEMYENVSDTTKEIASIAWKIAIALNNPVQAANFLNSVTEFYRNSLTEEEVEFLQFYFNMKMEMIKQ